MGCLRDHLRGGNDVNWWKENNLRLIQCNLRETDAQMDVDKLMQTLLEFQCNVLMVGAGGLTALYPTALPIQYKSPYLKEDLLGKLTARCHENGIKLIARFDFSKAHQSFLAEHPDWFYRSLTGEVVNFNEMVHTCVNGEYQQIHSLQMIREVLERYPVDGVFFNMFGYQVRDYSERYHGICQCENCRRRYGDFCGKELPTGEDDPRIATYRSFQQWTVTQMLENIQKTVHAIRPEGVLISTYTDHCVDLIRNESNTALSRPLPKWIYSASDNCMTVRGSYPEKQISNCAINAADIFWRFMGVSPDETKVRLLQNLASGCGLDFCIIGVFEDYPDTAPFQGVKEVFSYHKQGERQFRKLSSYGDVVLIKPNNGDSPEYRGIFQMLKQAHIPFDVLKASVLEQAKVLPSRYRLAIAPDVAIPPEKLPPHCSLLATGERYFENPQWCKELFGAEKIGSVTENKGAYLAADSPLFPRLAKRKWVLLDDVFHLCRFSGETALPYLPPARYGPPERCGGSEVSEWSGVGMRRAPNKTTALLPWKIGTLYYRHGFLEHRSILLDLMDDCGYCPPILIDAPASVESWFDQCPSGDLLQLVNLSGFQGVSCFPPLPISQITVRIPHKKISIVENLLTGEPIPFRQEGADTCFTVDGLFDYLALLLKEDSGDSNASLLV